MIMENLMNVVQNLASKKFNIVIIDKNDNDILTVESKKMTYLELGTYLLTHDISLIEITISNDT